MCDGCVNAPKCHTELLPHSSPSLGPGAPLTPFALKLPAQEQRGWHQLNILPYDPTRTTPTGTYVLTATSYTEIQVPVHHHLQPCSAQGCCAPAQIPPLR